LPAPPARHGWRTGIRRGTSAKRRGAAGGGPYLPHCLRPARQASRAEAQDPVAWRHRPPGDVAAGSHAADGFAGTRAEAAPDHEHGARAPYAKLRGQVVPQAW